MFVMLVERYRYIGNCGCLCGTLTDRFYITLTQAQLTRCWAGARFQTANRCNSEHNFRPVS
jgi:hypothetical protein